MVCFRFTSSSRLRRDFHPDILASTAPKIRLDGTRVKFIAGSSVTINSAAPRDTDSTLRGLDATVASTARVEGSFEKDSSTGQSFSTITVPDEFPRGSVMIFATWMDELPADLDEVCSKGATEAFSDLGMVELNVVLYRADGEERDAGQWLPRAPFLFDVWVADVLGVRKQSAAMAPTMSPASGLSSTAAFRDGCLTLVTSWRRTIWDTLFALIFATDLGQWITSSTASKSKRAIVRLEQNTTRSHQIATCSVR